MPAERTLEDVVRAALRVGDIRSAAIFVPASGSARLALAAAAGIEGPALDGLTAAVQDPAHPVARALAEAGPTFDALPVAPGGPRLRSHVPIPATSDDDRPRAGVLAVAHDLPLDDVQRQGLLDLATDATAALAD